MDRDLELARQVVAAHLVPTPVQHLAGLEGTVAKFETAQPTGSFKVRGALAAVAAALAEDPSVSVLTASAGNHGLGLAYAAQQLGASAAVVVAETASPAKIARLRGTGVELILHGDTFEAAEAYALELAAERSCRFISAYNDPAVIAGQATVASELLDQVPEVERIVVPVGGGGLAAGVALIAAVRGVEVIGVQAGADAVMAASLVAGHLVEIEAQPTAADGLAGALEPGSVTFDLLAEHLGSMLCVDEEELAAAVWWAFAEIGAVIEGSAAVSLAAVRSGAVPAGPRTAILLTGRNLTVERYAELLARGQAAAR